MRSATGQAAAPSFRVHFRRRHRLEPVPVRCERACV